MEEERRRPDKKWEKKGWWDGECRQIKKRVREILRRRRECESKRYKEEKRKYKKLCREKKGGENERWIEEAKRTKMG